MLWHIGNTTVRTPYRLRDALRAINESSFNGNIVGKQREHDFAVYLHKSEVLNSPAIAKGDDVSSLGRKWRAALSQLGFITPCLSRGLSEGDVDPKLRPYTEQFDNLSGRPFEITPNGKRLLENDILPSQQECFLRSLLAYQIPSILEQKYVTKPFSPLQFVLAIFNNLENHTVDPKLSFQEFTLFVQTSTPFDDVIEVTNKILEFRNARLQAAGNVRAFDKRYYADTATIINRQTSTLNDYADLSFRYLKATGLSRNSGRGITQNPAKKQLIKLLLDADVLTQNPNEYLMTLWTGAPLPTDNVEAASTVVADLTSKLRKRGVDVSPLKDGVEIRDIQNAQYNLEAELSQLDEQDFADAQAESLDEILAWMDAIPKRGSAKLPNGDVVTVPQGEAPAYLEWIIWRAFLAINSLVKPAWEARRFQIDQDFLPVHHAPGGGPDMIFEFDNAIIVVEVTLTASSRQEAAEGEPVRRHVAKIAENSDKQVYGLFIALKIDSNTAHTFRSGDWYKPDDTKMSLRIVPMTLVDFRDFLKSGQNRLEKMPDILKQVLLECRAASNEDAPVWKDTISDIISKAALVKK